MRPYEQLSRLQRSNEIVDAYWELFSEIFSAATPTPPRSATKKESEASLRFFRDLYVCFREGHVPPVIVDGQVISEAEIGTHEEDVLRAILNTDERLLVVVGDVGRGKTSLLKYTLEYLPSISPALGKKLHTLMIDCYKQRSSLCGTDSNVDVSVRQYLDQQINKFVGKILSDTARAENDDFWTVIKEFDEFRGLADFEKDTNSLSEPTPARREIHQRRRSERQMNHFYLRSAPYIEYTDGTLAIVFDNVDALKTEAQLAVLNYAREIGDRLACEALITMRTKTWQSVSPHLRDNGHGLYKKMIPPDVATVIKRRTETVLSKLDEVSTDRDIEVNPEKGSPKRVRINRDVLKANLSKLHEHLLEPERFDIIDNLASSNIRVALRLSFRAYQSGRWRSTDLFAPLLGIELDDHSHIPEHVFLEALLRGRDVTFAGRSCHVEGLINMFSNGNSAHPLSRLVRPLLIGRLRLANDASVSVGELLEEWGSIGLQSIDFAQTHLRYAIFRLLNAHIIESPDVYFFDKQSDVSSSVRLRLTSAGRYYATSFMWEFSYLMLVKDDIFFDEDSRIPYRPAPRCNSLSDHARETVSFANFLLDQESELLLRTNAVAQKTIARWLLGITSQPSLSMEICRALVKFISSGKNRIRDDVSIRISNIESQARKISWQNASDGQVTELQDSQIARGTPKP